MKVTCEKCSFENVDNCLCISNGETELMITTDFGPRILRYGLTGKKNVFKIFSDQLQHREKDIWKSYGGHRLWHAPEVYPRTYYPDNDPVEWQWKNGTLLLKCPVETGTGIGKQLAITLSESGSRVTIEHCLTNSGMWPIKIAAWCLSVMAAGGTAIVPQEEYRSHPGCLVPARPLVLWHFTKMNDHRFAWGERYITLREDSADKTKQKFGVLNTKGWAAYILDDQIFMKKTECRQDAEYTDMGCNQEFYTEAGFLEIESLSPYTALEPGATLVHDEKWLLSDNDVTKAEPDFSFLENLAERL